MPIYSYKKCNNCNEEVFKKHLHYNDYTDVIPCPCGNGVAKRIFENFNTVQGRTLNQKKSGGSAKRIAASEYMKDQTNKRKQNSKPGTREHDSNEFWLGSEKKKDIPDII